jgi:hypothetical protein
MPPRARKTAPPAPSLEDAAAQVPEPTGEPSAVPAGEVPAAPALPAPEVGTGDELESAVTAPVSVTPDVEDPLPTKAEALANRRAAAPPSYHWETPAGAPGDPCRACNPAGPPPGSGSIGCAHGQWVRVPDDSAA